MTDGSQAERLMAKACQLEADEGLFFADEIASEFRLAAIRISTLEALISEASIERLAEDIAIACVDCRQEIKEARHRAMVRLGERLRKPFKSDLRAASAMSTGTAKTPQAVEGQSPASAVPKADAQPSSRNPE